MQNNIGIYRYVNKQNGKSYIGQSLNLKHRHNEHLNLLRRGIDGCVLLQRAWNKYGEDNFEYEVLCYCSPSELDDLEIQYIKEFNTYKDGYNCNEGGAGNSGFNHSAETKARISKSSIGRKATPETIQKMSVAQKGRVISNAHKKALSDAWTDVRKQKLSISRMGVNNPNFGKSGKESCNFLPIVSNTGEFFYRRRCC